MADSTPKDKGNTAKRNSVVAMCFCTFFLSALATHAANSKQYLRDDDFEIAEWKILKTVSGDLNGDGIVDTVSVGQEVNRDNLKKNAGYGRKVLNLNPRDLGIMFGTRKGDRGKTVDVDGFLPPEHLADEPCLLDPLEGGDNVEIRKGILEITLRYFYSCGSWETSTTRFKFRYQNGRFRLIGLEESSSSRNTGKASTYSTNFLTGKRKIVTENYFDPNVPRKVVWQLLGKRVYYLDQMSSECQRGVQGRDWCT